jgi:hypothetical protein
VNEPKILQILKSLEKLVAHSSNVDLRDLVGQVLGDSQLFEFKSCLIQIFLKESHDNEVGFTRFTAVTAL